MHGDTTLGGVDYVRRLMDFCQNLFKETEGESITGDYFAIEQLRIQCERAKRTLS